MLELLGYKCVAEGTIAWQLLNGDHLAVVPVIADAEANLVSDEIRDSVLAPSNLSDSEFSKLLEQAKKDCGL
jgi:hypothetical protein